jgi:Cdc6-like AAA superfamily ATPase
LIIGPTGSGKTSCCKYALSTFDLPFVSISCEGYSTIRQFIRQLWNKILETIKIHFNGQKFLGNRIYKDSFENWRVLHIAPFNFSTLTQSLQSLLDSSFYRWPCINILFDRIDKTSKLEPALPSRLLNLAEVRCIILNYFLFNYFSNLIKLVCTF